MFRKAHKSLLDTVFLLALLVAPTVWCADLTVTSLDDPGSAGDGQCVLREAIVNANGDSDASGGDCAAGAGSDTIAFGLGGTIVLSSTLPTITDAAGLNIDGSGQSVTVNGNSLLVLAVAAGASLTLQHLTVTNGHNLGQKGGALHNGGMLSVNGMTFTNNSANQGGAIYSIGSLTITDSSFAGNSGTLGEGGAIYSSGDLSVRNSSFSEDNNAFTGGAIENLGDATVATSRFSGNRAEWGGGLHNGGTLAVTDSSFLDNEGEAGGAIRNDDGLTVSGSTIAGNSGFDGGGIFNQGSLTLSNSTVSGNTANLAGAGLENAPAGTAGVIHSTFSGNGSQHGSGISNAGTLNLANSIIADSTQAEDCLNAGSLIASGVSLVEDGSCGAAADPAHFFSGDPNLGPLADNGGPTQTLALLAGSPAIDAADNGICGAAPVSDLDQRGVARPQDGNADGSAVCDLGAYEVEAPADACVTAPLLDDFHRPDGRLGSNWIGDTHPRFYRIHRDQLDVRLGGAVIWSPDRFGTDQAAFVTLSAVDPRSPAQGTLLKVQDGKRAHAGRHRREQEKDRDSGVPFAAAIAVTFDARHQAVQVSSLRPGKHHWRSYGRTAAAFHDGDRLGGCALANGDVRVYRNGALVTTVPLDPPDRDYFGGKKGKVGLWSWFAPRAILDDFGGGSIAP